MKKRHLFFWRFLKPLTTVFVCLKFKYTYEKAKDLPENYIVLSNHVTDYDMLLVAASFKNQMYFVGSEHIARWKLLYKFLKYAFEPILRYKGTLGASTVKDVLKAAREGKRVCLFAEGARCWDGVTREILPSTGKMIKTARCALVTYKITGGYFISPRWSGPNTRRGHLHGAPVRVYTAEELAGMSVDQINAIIVNDLHEDAYERQLAEPKAYKGKRLAEGMEDFLFICPECGEVDSLKSGGDRVTCARCGLAFRYTEYGMLEGLPFQTMKELARWQEEEVERIAEKGVTFTADNGTLSRVAKHAEEPVDSGPITLSPEKLTCGSTEIPLSDIANMTMHGKRAIVFSVPGAYYELIPAEGFNTLKFEMLYQQYKNRSPVAV